MDADTLRAVDTSSFPVWTCQRGHVNDPLRNPCRYCGDHQPCDAAVQPLSTALCGGRPTRAYPHGIRCAGHALSGQEPHATAGPARSAVKAWPEREKRVAAVADGRRPEIDPVLLGPPENVRKVREELRGAGWTVWAAVLPEAGSAGRARVLVVAYRGVEMVVAHWDQGVDLKWKPGGGSHWRGKVPLGSMTWTKLREVIDGAG